MRSLSIAAILCSVLAMGISITSWLQAEARADAALQKREKAIVEKHRPAVVKLCRDFGIKAPPEDAQTLDELLTPVEELFKGLSK